MLLGILISLLRSWLVLLVLLDELIPRKKEQDCRVMYVVLQHFAFFFFFFLLLCILPEHMLPFTVILF